MLRLRTPPADTRSSPRYSPAPPTLRPSYEAREEEALLHGFSGARKLARPSRISAFPKRSATDLAPCSRLHWCLPASTSGWEHLRRDSVLHGKLHAKADCGTLLLWAQGSRMRQHKCAVVLSRLAIDIVIKDRRTVTRCDGILPVMRVPRQGSFVSKVLNFCCVFRLPNKYLCGEVPFLHLCIVCSSRLHPVS